MTDSVQTRARWPRVVAALAVLATIVVATGVAVALSTAPAFISGALGQVLGKHVSIGSIRVRAGLTMRVELTELRIHQNSDPASEVIFEAPRAEGRQQWPQVLVGQLVPQAWSIQSPVVRYALGEGGSKFSLPNFEDVDISDGRLELETPRGRFSVEKLELSASRGLLSSFSGSAKGEVSRRQRSLGRFDLAFAAQSDRTKVEGRVEAIDLARLGLPAEFDPRGSATGRIKLDLKSSGIAASGDIKVASLSLQVPGLGKLAPVSTRIAGSGSWSGGALELKLDPLAVDDVVLHGPIKYSTAPDGHLSLDLAIEEFAPGKPAASRLNPLRLLGMRFATWQRVHDAIEGGWVVDGKLGIDLPVASLGALAFHTPLAPEQFNLHLRVVDGVYRPVANGEPFAQMSGEFDLQGDTMKVSHLLMSRYNEALPKIDVSVQGFSRLVYLEERYVPTGPGAIPGLGTVFASLAPKPAPGASAAPGTSLRATELRLEHPALLLPVRNATAQLAVRDGSLLIEGRGVVGGGMADVNAEWNRNKREVAVDLRYDYAVAGTEGVVPRRSDGVWLSGRFALERMQLGAWPLQAVSGRLSARGPDVQLSDIAADVTGGKLTASGTLSLADASSAPVSLNIDLRGADVAQVAHVLSFGEGKMSGRADIRGPMSGRLAPDTSFTAKADIKLDAELRDGQLRDLPEALQLARLPSLQGVLGLFGRAMRYESVEASFTIRDGLLRTERFSLLAPELRMLAAGEIDLNTPDKNSNLLVALLFAQTVDRVIEKVPLLGRLLLGKDQSLFALYVRLQGPLANPQVGLVPPNTVTAAGDFAGRVIGSTLRSLRDLGGMVLPLGGDSKGKEETPAPGGAEAPEGDVPPIKPPDSPAKPPGGGT